MAAATQSAAVEAAAPLSAQSCCIEGSSVGFPALLAKLDEISTSQARVERLLESISCGQDAAKNDMEQIKLISGQNSERALFIGSTNSFGNFAKSADGIGPDAFASRGSGNKRGALSSLSGQRRLGSNGMQASTAQTVIPCARDSSDVVNGQAGFSLELREAFKWDAASMIAQHTLGDAQAKARFDAMLDSSNTFAFQVPKRESHLPSFGMSILDSNESHQARSWLRCGMLDPYSGVAVVYDCCSVIVLLGEVIGIPIILAWDLPMLGQLRILSISALLFWTVGVFLSFITGFYSEGELEMRPAKVARRYGMTWFIPDLGIIIIDGISLLLASESQNTDTSETLLLRLSKLSRALRLTRLLRLIRASEALTKLAEQGAASWVDTALGILKPLLAILVFNHLLACAWFAIGQWAPNDTGSAWLNDPITSPESMPYAECGFAYQYFTAMHWALTQMTPGSMQVFPRNSWERVFNVICLLLGMVVFSSIVSSFSAKLMQQHLKEQDKNQKLLALRVFMRSKDLNSRFRVDLMKHAAVAASGKSSKPRMMSDLTILPLLPSSVQQDLHFELCRKCLCHPLLRWWSDFDKSGIRALCHEAMDFRALAPGDNLFFPRARAEAAHEVVRGRLRYLWNDPASDREELEMEVEVKPRSFISEAALWTKWKHVGLLTAATGCELLSISAQGLARSLEGNLHVSYVLVEYARAFYARISALAAQGSAQITDMELPVTSAAAILPSLPQACRLLVGVVAARKLKLVKKARSRGLTEEVRAGTTCLMVGSTGEVERVVALVALELVRQEDNRFLAEVGKVKGESVVAECRLPAIRQHAGETRVEAVGRLVATALAPMAEAVEITRADPEEVVPGCYKRFKVATTNVKTLTHAVLSRSTSSLGLADVATVGFTTPSILPARQTMRGSASLTSWMAASATHRRLVRMSGASACSSENSDNPTERGLEVFAMLRGADDVRLYAWLDESEFEEFNKPSGSAQLERIISRKQDSVASMIRRTRMALGADQSNRSSEGNISSTLTSADATPGGSGNRASSSSQPGHAPSPHFNSMGSAPPNHGDAKRSSLHTYSV